MKKIKEIFMVGKNNIKWIDSNFIKAFGDDEFLETESHLESYKLSSKMNDSEIIKEFNLQECTLGDVIFTILNPKLDINNNDAYIFYIKGYPSEVVRMRWFSGLWRVYTWKRGEHVWRVGDHVFSIVLKQ